ncbi:LysM peptidoglycan-binding domain-containing protein, partial [Candidatus Saccharibacteria bacterium]|nr:LysM peptidoglycan-binding domain-containing protein [Candidatus Saccharibacteria bacterium]
MAQNNLNTNNLNVNNSTGDFDDQNLFNLDELVDRWVSPPGHLELPELSDEAKLRDQERYDKFRQEIEKSFDSITSEKPRWGEAHPSTDHSLSPGIYNGLKTYENAITVEEEDSRIILPNGRSIVVYDENNPASIWRAYRELSRPLARATSRKFGDFVRAEGSGALPEYCDEPDQILETNFLGLPQITAPQLKVGTAALVATAVLLSGATEASALDKTRTSAIVLNDTLSKKVEQTRQRPTTEVLNRQPQASEIHKVDLVYTPTRATHLRAVANDLKVPVKVLQEANPELSSTKEIPAGTKILGQAQSSVVELLRPVPVAELANNYGLTTDALKSVNQVSDDNQLSPGAVYIPGRLLIYTDLSVGDMNLELLAKSLQMSTTGTKELLRINKHAIDGIVAIPLVNLPQSEQLPSAQYVALAVQAPVLALEAPSNDASVAEVSTPTTTSTESPSTEAPVVNSTPAIAPEVPTDGVIQEPEVATPEAPAEPVAEIPAETIPVTLVDVFASQRDNPNMGSRPNGKSINSSNTCNITSLTMALQQIDLLKDVPVDAQPEQVVVFKYLSELAKQGKDITDPFALQKLAEQFGAKGDVREVKNNILFWIDLNNRLLNGE